MDEINPNMTAEEIEAYYDKAMEEAENIIDNIHASWGDYPTFPKKISQLGPIELGDIMSETTLWLSDSVTTMVVWARGMLTTKKETLAGVEAALWDEPDLPKSDDAGRRRYCKRNFMYVKHNRDVLIWKHVLDTLEQELKDWDKKVRVLSRVGGFEVEVGAHGKRAEGMRSMPRRPPKAGKRR